MKRVKIAKSGFYSVKGYRRKCEGNRDCEKEAIHIHHRDRNHSNNEKINLMYLCASCHRQYHMGWEGNAFSEHSFDTIDYLNESNSIIYNSRLLDGFSLIDDEDSEDIANSYENSYSYHESKDL